MNSIPNPDREIRWFGKIIEVLLIMATHRQVHEESGRKKSSPDLKIHCHRHGTGNVCIEYRCWRLRAMLPIRLHRTVRLPIAQPQDLITVLATQAQSVIASLTAQPTVVPPAPSADVAWRLRYRMQLLLRHLALMANSGTDAVPLIHTGTAGVDQYTSGQRING